MEGSDTSLKNLSGLDFAVQADNGQWTFGPLWYAQCFLWHPRRWCGGDFSWKSIAQPWPLVSCSGPEVPVRSWKAACCKSLAADLWSWRFWLAGPQGFLKGKIFEHYSELCVLETPPPFPYPLEQWSSLNLGIATPWGSKDPFTGVT